jgi:hypothetical protein
MIRKLRVLWLGLGLVAAAMTTSLVPAGTLGHTTGTYHYWANCSSGDHRYNAQAAISRTGSYKRVRAEVHFDSNLAVCTNPDDTNDGWSLLNGANFIEDGASGQFGIAEVACISGHANCHGFTPYLEDFWWTPVDNSLVIQRADWIDFDGDGVHDRPYAGEDYRMEIIRDTSGASSVWDYCVLALSNSRFAGAQKCKFNTHVSGSSTGYMTTIWWGIEVWNDASVFGALDAAPDETLQYMQYMNYNGSAYTTVTSENTNCVGSPHWVVSSPSYPYNTEWLSEHCSITGGSSPNVFHGWTAWHN